MEEVDVGGCRRVGGTWKSFSERKKERRRKSLSERKRERRRKSLSERKRDADLDSPALDSLDTSPSPTNTTLTMSTLVLAW